MEKNVGQTDSLARIALGAFAGVISLGLLGELVPGPTILSPVLGVVALVMVGTGVTGFCGLYSLIGVNTCDVR
ncbi:DUF2892 domain-containing protein [Halobellus sp. Atlit-31R]|nr:DUF2892 domain-containing protein [Halobellus sp. Atlit-31R]